MHTGYQLLPAENLIQTNPLDQGEWAYRRGPLGWVIRSRFTLASVLMDRALRASGLTRFDNCLEIGYGSGIFIPELARRAHHVHGVDVHDQAEQVQHALAAKGVTAELLTAGAEDMPVPDSSMDLVVALSSLEFIDDLEAVGRECRRILRPGGHLIVVTPASSPVLDLGLRVLTRQRAEDTFEGRRGSIIPTLAESLELQQTLTFPRFLPGITVYTAGWFTRQQDRERGSSQA